MPTNPRLTEIGEQRRLLWRNGYRPLAVMSHTDKNPKEAGKKPFGPKWQERARQDPPEVVRFDEAVRHALNTGILADGFRVVDVDIDDRERAAAVKAIMDDILGPSITRRRANSYRFATVYRAAEGEPGKRALKGTTGDDHEHPDQVEVLGRGQQFVAYGTHATGVELYWAGGPGPLELHRDQLRTVTEEQLTTFLTAIAPIIGAAPPESPKPQSANGSGHTSHAGNGTGVADITLLADALAAIPVTIADDYTLWIRVGCALYHATNGSEAGRELWTMWSRQSDKFDADLSEQKWASFGNGENDRQVNAGTIFHIARQHGWNFTPPNIQSAPPPAPAVVGWVSPTEDAVALAFAAQHQGRIVFDHTEEHWFCWNGSQWLRDLRNSVFNDARELTRAVRDRLNKAPAPLAKMAFVNAVERACRSDPRLAVDFSVWDRDSKLLGTPENVVDTATGLLLPPNPTLYISRHVSVVPAPPGTPTPIWDKFLDQATKGDKAFQAFIHRAGGYMLTGDVSEEVLFFFYGPGGNGKGTILSVLMGILGDYAISVPIEVFTAASRVNLEYYRAQMAGARLITASETEQQAVWSETLIKDLTGNDSLLSGRHPYGKPFTFRPQAKLLIIGNYAPKLRHRSPAMERRLRVAPFLNVPANPDPELKEKLKAEYPAILRRFIDGCLDWRQHRLGTPAVVQQATDSYFEQQDAFRRWLDERCTLLAQFSTKTGTLRADFNHWARANGEDEVSGRAFAELIDHTPGLNRLREPGTGARMTNGIALKPPLNHNRYVPDDDLGYGEQGPE
jgi:putative DNA primase/helicase